MVLGKIANFVVRGFQILFGACVLGLSVVAIHWQRYGSTPATNGYAAFVGAFGILTGLIGLLALFISRLEKPMPLVDGLAALMFVAGGIAYAVQLRHVDCDSGKNRWTNSNDLINGGCHKVDGERFCGFDEYEDLKGRCHIASANAAFLFLGFLAATAAAVICWLAVRKAKRSYGGSV